MCIFHETASVLSHLLTNLHVLLTDLIYVLSIGPDLIICTATAAGATSFSNLWLSRLAIAVETHHRAKCTPLKPANE